MIDALPSTAVLKKAAPSEEPGFPREVFSEHPVGQRIVQILDPVEPH